MELSLVIDKEDLGKASQQLWDFISVKLDYLSQQNFEIVKLAFNQMVLAHNQQRRKSGDFYIIHPVQACSILAEMKLDTETLAACLLHDVPEDTEFTIEDLGNLFSPEIVFLVSGVTKLSIIKYRENDIYAKNIQRLIIAMNQDLRVILIKLADRIHNLTTLDALKPEKAKRIALESLEIYVPIARRLGLNWLSELIENSAFQYAYPDIKENLTASFEQKLTLKTAIANKIITLINHKIKQENFKMVGIIKKPRTIYSIFRKSNTSLIKAKKFQNNLRIVCLVKDFNACNSLLNLLERTEGIALSNIRNFTDKTDIESYKGIKFFVTLENGEECELQIKTKNMYLFYKYGIGLLWSEKLIPVTQQKSISQKLSTFNVQWIKQLVNLGNQDLNQEIYLDKLIKGLKLTIA